ncbi:D-alanyl-D-alanine carboxypeptidase [Corynebacterium terpenotabidum Y-11]|uniref:D-alanyl-D-alanine carboxypeptidase n=1 Tax=Corynebacterium terpenotabidum Y-11 TaxID=1200352 RepID=S4XFZ2_9CORY|nr:D-alanyl-D-alanine carboxypeptidase [Corynebacterium terpenotabidum Y-11]
MLLISAAPAAAQDTGLNGMSRDQWLPTTVASDAPLPDDATLDTDDCRYDAELPSAFDADALRTSETAAVITVERPGPGGEGMDTCGTVAADGVDLPERLSLGSYVLYDVDSGEVLAAKDPYGLYRPASVIKILLVMIALDDLDMDELVPVTAEMANVDGSKVGVGPDGKYTARQLLQGLVMNSGNDAALALAGALGGTDTTVDRMQELANSLGAVATTVTTVNGLDTPDVQTTAYDLAQIYRAAFQREDVRTLLSTETATFPGYGEYPEFQIASDNGMLYDYPGALGGKTGFTDNARHTFAAAAQRDGRTLGVVMLNSTIAAGRLWSQAESVLDAGFDATSDTSVGTLTGGSTGEDAGPDAASAASAAPTESSLSSSTTPLVIAGLGVVTVLLAGAWRLSRRRS